MITPVGHRVLVKPLPVEKKTAGGILLADTVVDKHQRDQQKGVVVAIGENAWKAFDDGTPWCKVGDLVLFSRYGGKTVYEDEQEFRVLNDEDIVAVVSENVTT